MNKETAATEDQNDQINIIGDIFANMLHDAEQALAAQRAAMEAQITTSTLAVGNMIKDAMLNISASAGLNGDLLKACIARKKLLLDTLGHTDETEGGSQD